MVHYRIKEICSEKGITQKELAAKVELSTTSLSRIITGDQKPSLDTLEKVASALHVGISDLFGDSVASDANTIICPHCGERIKLSVEK